jgi:hypothetical protein
MSNSPELGSVPWPVKIAPKSSVTQNAAPRIAAMITAAGLARPPGIHGLGQEPEAENERVEASPEIRSTLVNATNKLTISYSRLSSIDGCRK